MSTIDDPKPPEPEQDPNADPVTPPVEQPSEPDTGNGDDDAPEREDGERE